MFSYARGLKTEAKRAPVPLARRMSRRASALPIELWGMYVDAEGRLCYAGRDVLGIVQEAGETPVHLLDAARLDANVAAFQRSGAEVYYSFKTQPLPWVIRRLMALGAGAEVISEYELRLALHLGAPAHKIIFNGPGKTDASIRLAIESQIFLFNINHLEEVDRVANIAHSLGRTLRVGVRANTSGGWSSQFGCSIASGEALRVYQRALQRPELQVVGLHSHRGSHIYRQDELIGFAGEVLGFADRLRSELDIQLEVIDFGGSLGIPTVREFSMLAKRLVRTLLTPVGGPDYTTRLDPEKYAEALVKQVKAHFKERKLAVPCIAVEPGRALTGNTQALVTRILTTRKSDGITYAVLDAGVNIAGILNQELHQIYRVTDYGANAELSDADKRLYRLVGPICQPGDVTFHCVRLPKLSPGDVLMIMDSGAYFEPDSTSFSFRRPGTLAVENKLAFTIRRAESFADMIDRDVFC
jgi:diaminopimelate decarboxylase